MAGVKEDAMLDYRASVVAAGCQTLAAPKADKSPGGTVARSAQADGTSFGDVFSEACADQRPAKSDHRDPSPEPADQARPESVRAPAKKQTQRKKAAAKVEPAQHDQANDTAAADRQPAAPADEPSTSDEVNDAQAASPAPRDTSTSSTKPQESKPSMADAASSILMQQGIDPATSTDATQQAAAATVTTANVPAELANQAPVQSDAEPAAKQAAKGAGKTDTAMQPLQWLAREQAARLSAKTAAQTNHDPSGGSIAGPLKALVQQPQAADQPAAQPEASKGATNLFAKILAGISSKNNATTAATTQPSGKIPVERIVQSLSADVSSLLPDEAKDSQARASQAIADQPRVAEKAAIAPAPSTATTVDFTTASQTLAPDQQAASQSSATYGATAKDAAFTLDPNGADSARNADHLAKIVYSAAGRGQSIARMNLKPPELGDVTATVRMNQGRMELKLEVGSEAAREVVAGGLDRLRENLQHQGISLDTASVTIAPKAEPSAGKEHQQGHTGQDSQQQAASQGQHGGSHGQSRQESFGSFSPDFAPAGGAAGEPELVGAQAVSYSVSLNVVA